MVILKAKFSSKLSYVMFVNKQVRLFINKSKFYSWGNKM
jgi:hypothetical protein